jgi:hypothetical protein
MKSFRSHRAAPGKTKINHEEKEEHEAKSDKTFALFVSSWLIFSGEKR